MMKFGQAGRRTWRYGYKSGGDLMGFQLDKPIHDLQRGSPGIPVRNYHQILPWDIR